MEKAAPRELTYATAIADVLLEEGIKPNLREARIDALHQAMGLVNQYEKWGFRSDLLDVIMEKKAALIQSSDTLETVRKAAMPPSPRYTGASWLEDPLTVPEEELILWSQTSLSGPLAEHTFKRFVTLFMKVFQVSELDLVSEDLAEKVR
jgi:hypothetical protein